MTLKRHRLLLGAMLVTGGFTLTPGCGSDDNDTTGGATCTSTGGPVEGPADHHCIDDSGKAINQSIGKCTTGSGTGGGSGAGGAAGSGGTGGHAGSDDHDQDHDAGGAGHEHGDGDDDAFEVRYGNEAADDECKYDARFSNTCIQVDKPVTLTLTLRQRKTGNPGNGAHPDSPEIYLASNPSHISPSNAIKATEGPLGTYQIGPIVFDVAGRWVVRFHYFEQCSDVPADSPHGHVAFYVDVP